jgi:hypothetical protein
VGLVHGVSFFSSLLNDTKGIRIRTLLLSFLYALDVQVITSLVTIAKDMQGLEVQGSPLQFNLPIPSFYGVFETKPFIKTVQATIEIYSVV